MLRFISFVCIVTSVSATITSNSTVTNLNGYQVLGVTAVTPSQFNFLKTLANDDRIDFWTEPMYQGVTDIMVAPSLIKQVTESFKFEGLKWSVKISDVGRIVAEQAEQNKISVDSAHGMTWTAYHDYETIIEWLRSFSENELLTLTTIGKSYEGRDIVQVKISNGLQKGTGELKPAIFIDAMFHAREWISGAATTWIINEILTNPNSYENFLSKFDIFFVPVANPDGYAHSRARTSNRMWRKTRNPNSGSSCLGVDPNRNFGFKFGGDGTSSSPCSDIFKGPNAFSEPETQAVRDAIKTLQAERTVHAYFTIHSYGQLWMLSWGYARRTYPDDYQQLLSWGEQSVAAIAKVHGKKYRTGQGADLLYGAGGASDDWAKSEGVKYATTLEIRDTGARGFLLPAAQIIPTGQEIWAGIQTIENTLES